MWLPEKRVCCPHCGATFTAIIDTSEGSCSYIQDCEVCCAPIRFQVQVNAADEGCEVMVSREYDV